MFKMEVKNPVISKPRTFGGRIGHSGEFGLAQHKNTLF